VIPKNIGIYDTDTRFKGRTDLYIWSEAKIGVFDPRTLDYVGSRCPRPCRSAARADRRSGSAVGRQFYAGQVMMLDPDKKS